MVAAGAAGALIGLFAIFNLGGGWYFASVLEERALSASERRESLLPDYDVDVLEVAAGAITLDGDDDERVARDGTFGLAWDGGYALLGAILDESGDRVTREFGVIQGEPPAAGARAEVDARIYAGEPGGDISEVSYRGELGDYPAWFVAGERDTWFIFVHGNSMTRGDGLRMLPTAVEAGMPALVITYRNDGGAPEDPGGRLTYGKHEWRDVEAAVQYALNEGASSVVIEGMSMGGGIVTAFLLESELATKVAGVILDAPMLDFDAAVEHQAKEERLPLVGLPLPGTLVSTAEWLAGRRFGVDWDYLDYLDRAGELDAPILLIHGGDDDDVPLATSERLAEARPDLVRDFYVAEGAGHAESWNADPEEYRRRMLAFFAMLAID